MAHRSLRRLGAAALSLLAAAVAAPSLPAQVVVVSGTLDEASVRPGEAHAGTIRLRNAGAAPRRARIYAADYRFFADGRSLYEAPGSQPRSSAAWMGIETGSVDLAPGEEAVVRFRVEVPADPALRGTYWSVVMVETEGAPPAGAGRGMGITPVVRYAVQVATHLEGGEARLAFQAPRVHLPPGGPGRP
jgi:hypothetical protein